MSLIQRKQNTNTLLNLAGRNSFVFLVDGLAGIRGVLHISLILLHFNCISTQMYDMKELLMLLSVSCLEMASDKLCL